MPTLTKEKMTFIIKWVLGLEELNIREKELLQGQLTELLQIKETQDESFFFQTKSILDKIEEKKPNLLPNLKAGKIKSIIESNLILIKKKELKPEFKSYKEGIEEEIKEKSTLFDTAVFLWEVYDNVLTKNKTEIQKQEWNPRLNLKEVNKIKEAANIIYLEDLNKNLKEIRECFAKFKEISVKSEKSVIDNLIKRLEVFPQKENANYPEGAIYQANKEKIDDYLENLWKIAIAKAPTREEKLKVLFLKAENSQTEISIESTLEKLEGFNNIKIIKKTTKENLKIVIIRLKLRLIVKKEENKEEVLQALKNYRANEKKAYQLENKDNELDELITNLTEEKLQEILTQAKNPNLKVTKILSLKTEIENFKNGDVEQQKVFQKLDAQSAIDKLCLKIEENERKNTLKKARKSAKKEIAETRELHSVTLEQLNKYLEEKKITNDFDNYVNNIKKVEEINDFKKLVLEGYIPEIKQELAETNVPNSKKVDDVDEKLNFIEKKGITSELEKYRQQDRATYEKNKSTCEKEFQNLIKQINEVNPQEIPNLWWKISVYSDGSKEQKEIYDKYEGKAQLEKLVIRENLLKFCSLSKQIPEKKEQLEELEAKIEIPLKKEEKNK